MICPKVSKVKISAGPRSGNGGLARQRPARGPRATLPGTGLRKNSYCPGRKRLRKKLLKGRWLWEAVRYRSKIERRRSPPERRLSVARARLNDP
eukprot:5301409-Heterocapsa_arctica.AAC.1